LSAATGAIQLERKIMLAPNEDLARLFRPRTTIDADGTVEGYASLFGEVDQARDMVMPGAFRETLRLRGIRRVPMLFQHDPAEPVGVWLELREDQRGLFARGRLIPEVARGRELYALLRAGAIDGLSIGFRTVKGRVDPRSRIRKLDQIDLWEISVVTFPLLAGARVQAVKDARGAAPAQPDPSDRLFMRYPRFSFARKQAERDWQAIAPAAVAAAPLPRMPSTAPSGERLETVHAKRQAPPRRDRIRGWLADSRMRAAERIDRGIFKPT
jgi:HK97 family phage prohead protease